MPDTSLLSVLTPKIKTTGKAGGMLEAVSRCQWRGLEPTDTSDICKFAPQPQMRRVSFASLV